MSTVTLRTSNLILTGVSSSLSILGGGLILLTYAAIPQIRNFTRKLLVYLTIADLLTAIGNLVATVRYALVHHENLETNVIENCTEMESKHMSSLCVAQSFVTTFSNMASFFWTFIIAFHLWSNVVLRMRLSENYIAHLAFHAVAWIVPLILVTIVHQKGYLGEDYCFGTGVWCGIRSNLPHDVITTWMYIEDIGWQITCYTSTCFLYIYIKFYIKLYHRRQALSLISPNLRDEDRNFVFVWMVIYLLKLWGLVRFFVRTYSSLESLSNDEHLNSFLDFLLTMQSYGASGQAFWNCVIFCFCDRTVRTEMRKWLFRYRLECEPLIPAN